MDAPILDTDTLSEFLKRRNPAVTGKATAYLKQHGQFTFSEFTRFEIRRGYLDRRATRQLARFDVFCGHSLVLPINAAIFDQATGPWRRGITARARQPTRYPEMAGAPRIVAFRSAKVRPFAERKAT